MNSSLIAQADAFNKIDKRKKKQISYQQFVEKMYEDTFNLLRKAMREQRKVKGVMIKDSRALFASVRPPPSLDPRIFITLNPSKVLGCFHANLSATTQNEPLLA